jgi:hypothetical protein
MKIEEFKNILIRISVTTTNNIFHNVSLGKK